MDKERIQKVMAARGLCSRRAAEQMILQGRVRVNGRPVSLGDKMNPAKDLLSIDGETLPLHRGAKNMYIMLHKPRGYVTTVKDELGRKTVMDLVKNLPMRVFPVGRLDKDSEGLLLLTSDGTFANLLTHPSHGISKTYRVTVRPRINEQQALDLTAGVVLDDGIRTKPAVVHVLDSDGGEEGRSVIEITIKEGRNRQVRRMCAAVGLEVARLKRSSIGPLKLGMLKPGKWRELKPEEINGLKASAAKAARKSDNTGKRGGR